MKNERIFFHENVGKTKYNKVDNVVLIQTIIKKLLKFIKIDYFRR